MVSSTYLFFWLIMGSISSFFAQKRGKNPYLWFAIGMFLGILGIFLLFFMPKKKMSVQATQESKKEDEITIEISPKVTATELERLWYYLAANNTQNGPMSFDALKRAFRDEKISNVTYVWNEEMEDWKRFGELFKSPLSTS